MRKKITAKTQLRLRQLSVTAAKRRYGCEKQNRIHKVGRENLDFKYNFIACFLLQSADLDLLL
jgi:hypothetical protein